MNDKSEAIKTIRYQTLKGKNIPQEEKAEIVSGLLNANISKVDNTIISSEMPKEILGVAVDWNKIEVKEMTTEAVNTKITEAVKTKTIKVDKPIDEIEKPKKVRKSKKK